MTCCDVGLAQLPIQRILAGQNSTNLDSLFTGKFLGLKSDIADGSLRAYDMRKLDNLVGDYYVAPR